MTDMLEMIRTLGSQLRWAAELEMPPIAGASEVLIAGMGGSGISGSYAAAISSKEERSDLGSQGLWAVARMG